MKKIELSILVVLYNKKIQDSTTISSILQVSDKKKLKLTIVNNGPEKLFCVNEYFVGYNDFVNIKFYEYLENRSLSKIYNEFIHENKDSTYYIIFDDDSLFEPTLISNLENSQSDIVLPLIKSQSDNRVYYPMVNNTVVTPETALKINGLISITSGLAVSNKLVGFMHQKFGAVFDENFALYGIDTSFFARLQRSPEFHGKLNLTCQSMILHSLSRAENQPISNFRLRERLCDAALIARHYPDANRICYFIKKIFQNIYHCNFNNFYLLVKCYATGKHPRS